MGGGIDRGLVLFMISSLVTNDGGGNLLMALGIQQQRGNTQSF